MEFAKKNILKFAFLFLFIVSYSQENKNDSLLGSFTYLLKSKPNNLQPDKIDQEYFSLQISDKRSFFISENTLKFDSVFYADTKFLKNSGAMIDNRGKSFPKLKSRYLVIQTNQDTEYFRLIGMSLLSYKNPVINNWKLINETKIINSIICKKAEVDFKGREWIAWYSPEIPFSNGPYKFTGLPGLIIKITDKKGDYDFELVKSIATSELKGKTITVVNKNRYENSKLVTKQELNKARESFNENIYGSAESMGVILTEQMRENLRQRQKNNESQKKGQNPIELID